MSRVIDLVDNEITAPVRAPLTVDYARRHIKSLGHEDDVMIATWIWGAAQYFEAQTGRQIITATREVWMDEFPVSWFGAAFVGNRAIRIELPKPPLQSVVSVSYIDGDGNRQVFTDGASPETPQYTVKAPTGVYARRGWLEPLPGLTWPIAQCVTGAVSIRYVAGYGDGPDQVPELLRGILCYLVSHFDQNRGALAETQRGVVMEMPLGVQAMMDEFKYSAFPSQQARTGWWQ